MIVVCCVFVVVRCLLLVDLLLFVVRCLSFVVCHCVSPIGHCLMFVVVSCVLFEVSWWLCGVGRLLCVACVCEFVVWRVLFVVVCC